MSTTGSPQPRRDGERTLGRDGDSGGADPGQLSQAEIFEVLSSNRRRYVLHHLKQRQGPAELGELAERIAGWENGKSRDAVQSTERKNVYTALRQFHLPKMDEMGVVRFDERDGSVRLSTRAAEFDVYLDVVSGYDVPWSLYYTAISTAFGTFLAGVHLAYGPLGEVSVTTVAALFVVTILLFSLVHTYTNAQMRLGSGDFPR